uniref:Putative secreted protein n=1 Tax=Ixodes ricinus TaxID=34613 RepID=A0A6B0UWC1_IXORI
MISVSLRYAVYEGILLGITWCAETQEHILETSLCSHATGVHTCRGRTWRPEKSSWKSALVTLSSAQCRAYWSTRAPKPLYSPAAPSSATMDWKQSTGPRYWEMTAVTEEPVSKLSTMVLVPCRYSLCTTVSRGKRTTSATRFPANAASKSWK